MKWKYVVYIVFLFSISQFSCCWVPLTVLWMLILYKFFWSIRKCLSLIRLTGAILVFSLHNSSFFFNNIFVKFSISNLSSHKLFLITQINTWILLQKFRLPTPFFNKISYVKPWFIIFLSKFITITWWVRLIRYLIRNLNISLNIVGSLVRNLRMVEKLIEDNENCYHIEQIERSLNILVDREDERIGSVKEYFCWSKEWKIRGIFSRFNEWRRDLLIIFLYFSSINRKENLEEILKCSRFVFCFYTFYL